MLKKKCYIVIGGIWFESTSRMYSEPRNSVNFEVYSTRGHPDFVTVYDPRDRNFVTAFTHEEFWQRFWNNIQAQNREMEWKEAQEQRAAERKQRKEEQKEAA